MNPRSGMERTLRSPWRDHAVLVEPKELVPPTTLEVSNRTGPGAEHTSTQCIAPLPGFHERGCICVVVAGRGSVMGRGGRGRQPLIDSLQRGRGTTATNTGG